MWRRQQEVSSGFEAIGRETQRHFEAAIREDTKFSAAHSYFANYLLGVLGESRPAGEVVPRARELVDKALELNPNSSDAHTARGNLSFQADLDWTRAEAEFQQAIALNPSSSTAHFWYAYLLSALQRFEESRKQYRAAIDLDPLWLLPRFNLASTFCYTGELETAIDLGEKLAEDFPDSLILRVGLAWVYALAGRAGDAVGLVEPMAADSSLSVRTMRCRILGLLGRPEEARALLADWERGRLPRHLSLTTAAIAYAICGQADRALVTLERDYQEGDKTLWSEYQDPQFDPLRDDPRFVAMLRLMNLPTTLRRRRQELPVVPTP